MTEKQSNLLAVTIHTSKNVPSNTMLEVFTAVSNTLNLTAYTLNEDDRTMEFKIDSGDDNQEKLNELPELIQCHTSNKDFSLLRHYMGASQDLGATNNVVFYVDQDTSDKYLLADSLD